MEENPQGRAIGGHARAKKLGKKRLSESARNAANARWGRLTAAQRKKEYARGRSEGATA
jgi:hypothetical protein